jgi:putative phosphoesterase
MMRLLVLSDSHGDSISLRMAIDNTWNANAVIFLGDGVHDMESIMDTPLMAGKKLIIVRGNCDGTHCSYPALAIEEFAGVKTYCTHGHGEMVKYGYQMLTEKARANEAKLVRFGHTPTPYTYYENGLYFLNPGSVRENNCGVVDITPNGILCFNKKIVT